MITTIVRFRLPQHLSTDQARELFQGSAPAFQKVPGLLRKHFLLSDDGSHAGGSYLWADRDSAESFINNTLANMIRQKYHSEPEIEYFSSPVLVDNLNGKIIS